MSAEDVKCSTHWPCPAGFWTIVCLPPALTTPRLHYGICASWTQRFARCTATPAGWRTSSTTPTLGSSSRLASTATSSRGTLTGLLDLTDNQTWMWWFCSLPHFLRKNDVMLYNHIPVTSWKMSYSSVHVMLYQKPQIKLRSIQDWYFRSVFPIFVCQIKTATFQLWNRVNWVSGCTSDLKT